MCLEEHSKLGKQALVSSAREKESNAGDVQIIHPLIDLSLSHLTRTLNSHHSKKFAAKTVKKWQVFSYQANKDDSTKNKSDWFRFKKIF